MRSEHARFPNTAILLINLGSPEAPQPRAVRRYLRAFLSDPRVLECSNPISRALLRRAIVPLLASLRARASSARYASIWMAEGAPLRVYSARQAAALAARLARDGPRARVECAMRYGAPSIRARLQQLQREGIERVLLLPMYPQYSAAATASAFDATFDACKYMRDLPEIRTIRHYADFPPYIAACAQRIRGDWSMHSRPDFAAGDKLLLSFHGLPQAMIERGDPYETHCRRTAALLAQALDLSEAHWQIGFQSRFGLARWLQPTTAALLERLGTAKTRRVDVFCPGFTADCLETLEELDIRARAVFLRAGGGAYHRIACVNDSAPLIDALAALAAQHLRR
ncbi:Ferrochelatase (Protoheme ferro-lyase) (Heme synthetase) [Candidatus Glomeribacter gigasporarum BEG34]|uniref:Ferrochelatase n=1 Tax=Candidatus Glomeribacter gigasporarum BEG34 TaxID=1070319 RepID=G2J9R6_9BURK|nr:ferrochelatase [Candidatus Glomeribacter gigasporarum]CCD29513.1 Ferrochelatase (Protoheme ferro-lyase) (Heme synthetase) [Candidatus Glomeribacter gigasporarum BEG34]